MVRENQYTSKNTSRECLHPERDITGSSSESVTTGGVIREDSGTQCIGRVLNVSNKTKHMFYLPLLQSYHSQTITTEDEMQNLLKDTLYKVS